MLLSEILEIYQFIDKPGKVGQSVEKLFKNLKTKIQIKQVKGNKGSTEFISIIIPGKSGKYHGGKSPTLGIIGELGGIGIRPKEIGFVSDGDGALTVLSVALRLSKMQAIGDELNGDVIITTHLCTGAPIEPHQPVPFMGAVVSDTIINKYLIGKEMDTILSVDTSRGNKIINTTGFAITPTVKEGWILKVADDLLQIMENVSGKPAAIVPITMQDITPYGNGLYHFNSILQPATATTVPVVGVAITSELPVPGCVTGVTNAYQIDLVGRFIIEVAKRFTKDEIQFYDKKEFKKIIKLYGKMNHLQRIPGGKN